MLKANCMIHIAEEAKTLRNEQNELLKDIQNQLTEGGTPPQARTRLEGQHTELTTMMNLFVQAGLPGGTNAPNQSTSVATQ